MSARSDGNSLAITALVLAVILFVVGVLFGSALMIVFGAIFLLLSGLSRRNVSVYDYTITVLAKVSLAANGDIDHGRPWRWRYDAYDALSYNALLWHFWRPLNSWMVGALARACDPEAVGPGEETPCAQKG